MQQRAPFAGRDAERKALRSVVDAARSGEGSFALVEGEAGIGKSRLVADVLAYAEPFGFSIAGAAAAEIERDRPFGAIASALGVSRRSKDSERARLAALMEEGADPSTPAAFGGPGLRFRIVEAIMTLVERTALAQPLVLAIEDLHWADSSTLIAIHEIARSIRGLPVVLLGTLRPSPRSNEIDRLVEGAALHVRLGPLDAAAVEALVSAAVGARPGRTLLAQLDGASGNPFLVGELLDALRDAGSVRVDGGVAELHEGGMPPPARQAILRRFRPLPDAGAEAVRVAAVLGSAFSVSDLALVLDRPATSVLAEIDEPVRAGLIGDAGERLAFRHDLVREAIYEDMPLAVRRALHLQAARAFARAGGRTEQTATHFALGAEQGDVEAVEWLRRAAVEAGGRAPSIACDRLERALALTGEADPVRASLQSDLTRFLLWTGRIADAESLGGRALRGSRDAALLGAVGSALYLQGRWQEASERLDAAVEGEPIGDGSRALVLAHAAFARAANGRLAAAVEAGSAACALAAAEPNPLAASIARAALCWAAFLVGDAAEAIEHARAAVDCERDDLAGEVRLFSPRLHLGLVLAYTDRLDEAREVLRAGRAEAEELGAGYVLPLYHAARALLDYFAGAWDDALAEAATSIELAEETGARTLYVLAHTVVALVASRRDDEAAALAAAAEAQRFMAACGVAQFGAVQLPVVSARLAEARGDLDGALAALGFVWALFDERSMLAGHAQIGLEMLRLALQTRDAERAAVVAKTVGQAAERLGTPSSEGAALLCRARLERDVAAGLAGVDAMRKAGRPFDLAVALEDAGTMLAEDDRGDEAVPMLEEAAAVYEHLGAFRRAAAVDATLRTLGVRRGRRGKRDRPTTGWDALTRTEASVAALTAEGLTNPEIGQRLYISRRTVQRHLSNIFLKLGVSTRVQLAAEAARRSGASG